MVKESEPTLNPDLEMWRDYAVSLMRYDGYFMFVAEANDTIIGFVDYAMQPEPGKGIWVATINYFYVVPDYRRTDVSGQLWEKAIESAKGNKAVEFSAICFPDRLDFWERHGFTKQSIGIRRTL